MTFVRKHSAAVSVVLSVTGGFLLWEMVSRFIIRNPLFLVPPSGIASRFTEMWGDGEIQHHVYVSGVEAASGFVLAAFAGVAIGLAVGANARLRVAVSPWISGLYATPIVALAPLVILWFGLGLMSKTVVVFSMAIFPVLINTQAGIESTEDKLIETARAFGASKRQIFQKIYLPSAVPFIVAGLRLAVGRSLVGVVVAELFGSRAGLGFLIMGASQTFDMGALFVAVLILALAGVLSTEAIKLLERRIAPWRWA